MYDVRIYCYNAETGSIFFSLAFSDNIFKIFINFYMSAINIFEAALPMLSVKKQLKITLS